MNKKYNGALDFWKFVFCLVILVFHVGEVYGGKHGYLLEWGRYAVEMFFIVSGYFMCVSAAKAEERHSALPFIRSDGSYRHICIAMHWGFVYGLWKLADMYI